MDNFLTWIKLACGAVCVLFSYLFGGLDVLLSALLVCMATDYVTGVFAAIYQKRLNSQTGFRGILKKLMMLALVVLSHMLETAAGVNGIRDLVVGFYIANEGISILENAGRMNVPIARSLYDFLEQLKQKQ